MQYFIGRHTCLQAAATVFALGWATCPLAFAVERGKQEGKRVTREIVSRAVGVEQADTLLSQIRGMDLGAVSASATASDVVTLERPEGSYVFSQIAADSDNNISGLVTMFDPDGQKTGEAIISRIAFLDDNRIDFDISSSTPESTAGEAVNGSVTGSIVGLGGGAKGLATAFVAVDGQDTRPMMLNYGSLDLSGRQTSTLPLVSSVISTSTGGVATVESPVVGGAACGDGGVAAWGAFGVGIALWGLEALCVAIIVVLVIVLICLVFAEMCFACKERVRCE